MTKQTRVIDTNPTIEEMTGYRDMLLNWNDDLTNELKTQDRIIRRLIDLNKASFEVNERLRNGTNGMHELNDSIANCKGMNSILQELAISTQ